MVFHDLLIKNKKSNALIMMLHGLERNGKENRASQVHLRTTQSVQAQILFYILFSNYL